MITTSVNRLFDYCQSFKPATEPLEAELPLPNGQNIDDILSITYADLELPSLINAINNNNDNEVQTFFDRFNGDFHVYQYQLMAIEAIRSELKKLKLSRFTPGKSETLKLADRLMRKLVRQAEKNAPARLEKANAGIRARNLEKTTRAFWRRVIYKGTDYTHSLFDIFNKNDYRIIATALALQVLFPANSDPRAVLNPSRIWEQLSVITEVPGNYLFSLGIFATSFTALKILRIKNEGPEQEDFLAIFEGNSSIDQATNIQIRKESFCIRFWKEAIRISKTHAMAATLEEIYFRFVIQGSLASFGIATGMEMNTANFYARMTASTLFGLAYTKQSLAQAITAAISGYYIYGRLYAEKGLLATTINHFCHNIIIHTFSTALLHLGRSCAKPGRKEHLHAT